MSSRQRPSDHRHWTTSDLASYDAEQDAARNDRRAREFGKCPKCGTARTLEKRRPGDNVSPPIVACPKCYRPQYPATTP